MSQKAENAFVGTVHQYLPPIGELYRAKMNNPYTAGLPDWWYSGDRGDLWIEYKFIKIPKRGTTVIVPDLSGLQLEWVNNRHAEGRNVHVLVGCHEGGLLFNRDQWNNGITTSEYKGWVLSRRTLAEWIINQVTTRR